MIRAVRPLKGLIHPVGMNHIRKRIGSGIIARKGNVFRITNKSNGQIGSRGRG